MLRRALICLMAISASCSPPSEGSDRPEVRFDAADASAAAPLDSNGDQFDADPIVDAGRDVGIAPSEWGELEEEDSAALQAQVEAAVENLGIPGAAIAIVRLDTNELGVAAAGSAGDEAWEPDRQFRIGSVTKTFTTALLLQLVGEGAVSLDDPLERWVPGYYDDVGVTLRHLATNTSGIVSYNYVGSFDDGKPWTPEELVEWAVAHEPDLRFAPGSQWEYSNTNFVLMGLVAQAATGETYENLVDTRLLDPLGLDDTYVAGSGDTNPRIVSCFDQQGTDTTNAADPSFGWAAGSIVSTPRDLARWAAALYGGDVLAPDMLALMTTPAVSTGDGGADYGMGSFIESDGTQSLYGHTGGIAGYMTYMYFLVPERYAVVAMSNQLGTNLRDLSAYGWSVLLGFEHP